MTKAERVGDWLCKGGLTVAIAAFALSGWLYVLGLDRMSMWIFPLVPVGITLAGVGLLVLLWTV